MNHELSKSALLGLLKATSAPQVDELIKSHPFFKKCTWHLYGDQENNYGTVRAQTPDSAAAIVEKITNGIDAILMRRCWEDGIDPVSPAAPQSMQEATKKYYGEKVAAFDLSNGEIRDLAKESVRIFAEGTLERPTITITDSGEGQHPADFPKTFLSLVHANKIKVKFVQGIYNQGGSAALKFCTKGYQLIISRRSVGANNKRSDWGFTLVREQYQDGYRSDWYEYCKIDGEIPSFSFMPLEVVPGITINHGTNIRLYDYHLKQPSFITTQLEGHLAKEINKRYFSMPLPIELNEQRSYLPGWEAGKNDKTRLYGYWRLLKKQLNDKKLIKKYLILKSDLGEFGTRDIEVMVIDDSSDESYRKQQEKVFLTVNGQAQHIENMSFLKTQCLLPDLAPYMVVHIDLSNAGHIANKIFETRRSGLIETPERDLFHQRLVNALKDDETLKELNREYRDRKLQDAQPEDKDLSRFIGKLVQDNPYIADLLGIGKEIPETTRNGQRKDYKGKYIPTYLKIDGADNREIPYNRYARVLFESDLQDDYLTRDRDRGEFIWSQSNVIQISRYSPRYGRIPVRIDPTRDVRPGEKDVITFELTRPGDTSLKVDFGVVIGEYGEPKINPTGTRKPPSEFARQLPKKVMVWENQWRDRLGGHDWDENEIATVVKDSDRITVYINGDPKVLKDFPKRNPRFSSGDMQVMIKKRYIASIYLYALALFFEFEDRSEERETILPRAMKAVSRFVLDLAFTQRAVDLSDDEED